MAKETHIKPATEVQLIATALIQEFHPELIECSILYLLTTASTKCRPLKPNPVVRYFASTHVDGIQMAEVASGPDYLVLVNDLIWGFQAARGKERPFVDHLLEHMAVEMDGEGIPHYVVKEHPLEEFPQVVQRFGIWSDELREMSSVIRQYEIPFDELVETMNERTEPL